ncbi:general secretion pathway protein I [Candidatus Magnetomoraceae bacterium gMMP-15]
MKFLRGFTLLEVMIAMSVLSVVLVSIFKLQGQSVNMLSSVRFYTKAPLLARLAMSRFEAELAKDPELESDSGDFGEDFPYYNYEITVNELDDLPEEVEYIGDYIKTIELTVTWGELGLSYSLSTTVFIDMT